jgi:hypothetical protein
MTNFRKGIGGILLAPRRGKPPPAPEGYEEIPGVRFQYRLKLVDCEHRYLDWDACGRCPNASPPLTCKIIERVVSRPICYECGANIQWIEENYGRSN